MSLPQAVSSASSMGRAEAGGAHVHVGFAALDRLDRGGAARSVAILRGLACTAMLESVTRIKDARPLRSAHSLMLQPAVQ
jgi:hypothetical protein